MSIFQAGEKLVYDMNLPIENSYPAMEITGRWKLIDENEDTVLCFEIPIKIKD